MPRQQVNFKNKITALVILFELDIFLILKTDCVIWQQYIFVPDNYKKKKIYMKSLFYFIIVGFTFISSGEMIFQYSVTNFTSQQNMMDIFKIEGRRKCFI